MRFLKCTLMLIAAYCGALPATAESSPAVGHNPSPEIAGYEFSAAPSEAWQPPASSTADSLPPPDGVAPTADPTTSALSAGDISPDEPLTWYQPTYWFGPAPWDSGIELGLNGATGTNEAFSVRTGGYIKRESRYSKLGFDTYYNRTTSGGNTTQNNANLDVRNDWLLDESSPWTLYQTGNVFYDEFQAFDLQFSESTGIGYRFVHDADLQFMTRMGFGTSREIGGPDDRWVPESLVGFEYSQRAGPTQKFYAKFDYYPDWDQVGEFRLVADAGWEIELVQPSNLSLKISATDRYDSTPNGAEPQLLNYSVLLLLKM
jgi:hypothetical protein